MGLDVGSCCSPGICFEPRQSLCISVKGQHPPLPFHESCIEGVALGDRMLTVRSVCNIQTWVTSNECITDGQQCRCRQSPAAQLSRFQKQSAAMAHLPPESSYCRALHRRPQPPTQAQGSRHALACMMICSAHA